MKLFSTGTNDTKISIALLVLRCVAGLSMALNHGLGKLENFAKYSETFSDPFGVGSQLSLIMAVFAEFFCGIFIAFGFATRFTVIPLIITMLTAFFIIHSSDPFSTKEMAFLYLVMFTTIFIIGPGKYSVDKLINK